MLIEFYFSNVKSFRGNVTLELGVGDDLPDFLEHPAVKVGVEKVLPVAAIFGPNGSGKSNVYYAFKCMRDYVVNSFLFGDDEEEFKKHRVKPFLLDQIAADSESSFQVCFTLPNDWQERVFMYGFRVDRDGVTEEWLDIDSKYAPHGIIFDRSRDNNKLDLPGFSERDRNNVRAYLQNEVLVLSLGAKLKIGICETVRDWFLNNRLVDYNDLTADVVQPDKLPVDFASSKPVQNYVQKYLNSFDDHIRGFRFERRPKTRDNEGVRDISVLHQDSDSESDELRELPLSEESDGTKVMFSLFPHLQHVFQNGSVLFADDLCAHLHPLLLRYILLMFLDTEINYNHAQLVFTTHEIWLLAIHLLRQDEIKFVEKDADGISTMRSVADITKGQDVNILEKYLAGEFGAIPKLKDIKWAGRLRERR